MRLTIKPAHFLIAPFLLSVGAFFVMPLLIIVAYSFMERNTNGGVFFNFAWDAYINVLFERDFDDKLHFNWTYLIIFINTLKLAGICTFFCLLIGFPTAWYMATRPPEKRNMWILLITIPCWINLLIRTYAWLLVLRDEGIVNNILMSLGVIDQPIQLLYNDFAVTMGLIYSYLPFMILPLYANLERMDWRLMEAAQDLYAPKWKVLTKVILPLAMPGIMAGCILVFIPAIGSFLAPELLGGGKKMMIGNLIYNQFMFSRNWPMGAAVSVTLMVIVMIGLMIIARKSGGAKSLL